MGVVEIWKNIEGWPYEVSSLGRVRRTTSRTNAKAGKILKQTPGRGGYLRVTLCCDGKQKVGVVSVLGVYILGKYRAICLGPRRCKRQ